jgi:TRAP-type C4-dicarboxylate transport system substrate-binding protein
MAGSAWAADTVTLRFSSFLPSTHWYVKDHLMPLFESIDKATEGRVKVELLPKVVGTALSQYDVVRDGLADMAYIIPGYTPGRFPLQEIGELPLLGDDVEVMSPAFTKLYREKFAQYNEFGNVVPFAIYNVVPVRIFNSRHQINTVADFKGLKLRSPGKVTTTALELLGAVPILKSSAEVYEMLSTGAIDGQLSVSPVLVAGNTAGFTKFATSIPGGIANSVHLIGLNADKWNEISEADRKTLETIVVPEFVQSVVKAWATQDKEAMKTLAANGYDVGTVGPEFVTEFRTLVKPIEDEWIDSAKKKGVTDPAAILAEFRAAIGSGQ